MKSYITDIQSIKKLIPHIQNLNFEYKSSKHQVNYYIENQKAISIRLPLSLAFDTNRNQIIDCEFLNYILIMIRSGIATVGYFENFENEKHIVFRAYMVRKKQGKSQIKHLKTKGKSRAGSRVRLQETLDFFEDISKRINEHFESHRIDRIGISCAETLIPYFYGTKSPLPFEKQDERIFKIPKHIQNPTYEALIDTNEFLKKGEVKFSPDGKDYLEQMNMNNDSESKKDQDDW
ncbi:hypothetical protein ACFOUP_07120 [Belliella kenyensis]|uniref:VLRF1 domain-containing protein n=1 Tax=Belliella kenyensis TaxID=1472724 RepID=A0ABV8EIQ9_9BACT|nr:hypothetical protein [Belliella kenyensis]MCH7400242.1 hypothetical protein [Belliella kenyensis]MDN3604741.1 hypothetical protein [Belliella kenyensis]